jgi:hypothetical protein
MFIIDSTWFSGEVHLPQIVCLYVSEYFLEPSTQRHYAEHGNGEDNKGEEVPRIAHLAVCSASAALMLKAMRFSCCYDCLALLQAEHIINLQDGGCLALHAMTQGF